MALEHQDGLSGLLNSVLGLTSGSVEAPLKLIGRAGWSGVFPGILGFASAGVGYLNIMGSPTTPSVLPPEGSPLLKLISG